MPFKSQSQRRKFYALKNEGKMDQKTINKWEKQTPKNIPEKVKKKASLTQSAIEKRANLLNLVYPTATGALLGGATGGLMGGFAGDKETAIRGAIAGAATGGSLGLLKNVARNKVLWNKVAPNSEDLADLVIRQKEKIPMSNREEFVNLLEKIPLATAAGGYAGYKTTDKPEKGFWG